MQQSKTDTWHQETGTLEHRQVRNTHKVRIQLQAFSSLYLSESIAKLEMTQYKRLTRSAKHEPPANTTKIVSEYGQEISQSQTSDKPMAP